MSRVNSKISLLKFGNTQNEYSFILAYITDSEKA
jgi:hypothetical protein